MTAEEYLARVRALLPAVRDRASHAEQLRPTPDETFSRVAEDPFIQFRLAEAASDIDAARERTLSNFAEMIRLASAGEEIPLTQRARYRWDAAKGIDWSVKAIDRLLDASGGRGIFLNNPIQRAWRDIHAMRAHAGNNTEKAAAIFGRSEFGLPPTDIRF